MMFERLVFFLIFCCCWATPRSTRVIGHAAAGPLRVLIDVAYPHDTKLLRTVISESNGSLVLSDQGGRGSVVFFPLTSLPSTHHTASPPNTPCPSLTPPGTARSAVDQWELLWTSNRICHALLQLIIPRHKRVNCMPGLEHLTQYEQMIRTVQVRASSPRT